MVEGLASTGMPLRLSHGSYATLVEMVSLATEMAALHPSDTGQAGYARFEGIENKVLEAAKSTGLASHKALNEEERRQKAIPLEKRYWEKFLKGRDRSNFLD